MAGEKKEDKKGQGGKKERGGPLDFLINSLGGNCFCSFLAMDINASLIS